MEREIRKSDSARLMIPEIDLEVLVIEDCTDCRYLRVKLDIVFWEILFRRCSMIWKVPSQGILGKFWKI